MMYNIITSMEMEDFYGFRKHTRGSRAGRVFYEPAHTKGAGFSEVHTGTLTGFAHGGAAVPLWEGCLKEYETTGDTSCTGQELPSRKSIRM